MKTLTKSILAAAALALLAALPVQAQSYDLKTTSLNGGTNNVATATTNTTFAVVMPVVKSTYIAPQVTFKLNGAGTDTIVFKFDHSVDGSNWKSAVSTLSVAANATTNVTGNSSITVGGIGYIRLSTVENPSSSSVTNLVLRYATKNGI